MLKYIIENEAKLYNGEMIYDLVDKFNVDVDQAISIVSAFSTDLSIANDIYNRYPTRTQSRAMYANLLSYGFADFESIEDMDKYLMNLFKVPKDVQDNRNVDVLTLINEFNKINKKDYDLTEDQIFRLVNNWKYNASSLMNQLDIKGILYHDNVIACSASKAETLNRVANGISAEDLKFYDLLDPNAEIEKFISQIHAINTIIDLKRYYDPDDPEFKKVIELYGDNETVLKNLLSVKIIKRSCGGDVEIEAGKLCDLFKGGRFIEMVSKSTISDSDKIVKSMVSYCMKQTSPMNAVKLINDKVTTIAEGFPFLKNTVERLEKLSVAIYDGVLDKQEEKRLAKAEERAKVRKEAKEKQEKELLPEAREAIKAYLNKYSDKVISVASYCSKYDIDPKLFAMYVNVVKKHDEEIYNLYKECAKKNSAIALGKMSSALDIVIHAMKKKEAFTLYKYYTLTKFDPKDLLKWATISDKITNKELAKFRRWYSNKCVGVYRKKEHFYEGTYTISGKELATEDVDKVLKYMSRNRYPYTESIFKEIARQYVTTGFDSGDTKEE